MEGQIWPHSGRNSALVPTSRSRFSAAQSPPARYDLSQCGMGEYR